jgi:hypothetical protein
MPRELHQAYHNGLDKVLPRWQGTDYFRNLSPTQQAENFEKLRKYTQAFDKAHKTKLWDAIKKNVSSKP